MAFDPARLFSQLLNTGLQSKDNPLYQVIYQLISLGVQLNGSSSSRAGNLVAGDGISLDTSNPAQTTISASGYWTLLTDGDLVAPELIWTSDGDVIAVFVPY